MVTEAATETTAGTRTGAPTVLLDKDGTLFEDAPYNVDPARVRLACGAAEGLASLARAGCRVAIVTNQSGVARGYFPERALLDLREHVGRLLASFGLALEGFYYCPHHPEGVVEPYARECECRKPRPGLVRRALRDLGAEADATWMVGDILDDIEAGRAAGCRTALVDGGHETEWRLTPRRIPHVRAADLAEAARFILASAPHSAGARA